jgi:hypothetical protein
MTIPVALRRPARLDRFNILFQLNRSDAAKYGNFYDPARNLSQQEVQRKGIITLDCPLLSVFSIIAVIPQKRREYMGNDWS